MIPSSPSPMVEPVMKEGRWTGDVWIAFGGMSLHLDKINTLALARSLDVLIIDDAIQCKKEESA
jgi:hypothetical protein